MGKTKMKNENLVNPKEDITEKAAYKFQDKKTQNTLDSEF